MPFLAGGVDGEEVEEGAAEAEGKGWRLPSSPPLMGSVSVSEEAGEVEEAPATMKLAVALGSAEADPEFCEGLPELLRQVAA